MSDNEKHYSDSADESSKPALLVKKKKKTEKPGYRMFDADDSDDETVLYDDSAKTPSSKLKKHSRPSFKFSGKIKIKEKERDDKKDLGDKRDEKEPRKLTIRKAKDKDSKDKELKTRKKKDKSLYGFGSRKAPLTNVPSITAEATSPVFGVALSLAVERNPGHDGVMLPVLVRECIDYIEEHGLLYEGIYRISGVKSKVQMLRDAYNRQQPAYLYEHDPSIVASLLKQFIRELPESLLTAELAPKFEEAAVIQFNKERLERLKICVNSMPPCNKELLSWMIVHMNHVIAKEKINKMSLQNVSIVLSPTMRISHRVLNLLFLHSGQLFSNVKIIRYCPRLQPASSRWSVDLPDKEEAIEDELHRQESLLTQLHKELSHHHSSENSEKEDKVWEVQRNVTQLKRKLKLISKTNAARENEKKQLLSSESVKRADPNRRSINAAELNFALQTGSLHRAHRSSQAELASSSASITASNEALSGQNKRNSDISTGKANHSQRTSTSSDRRSPQGCGEPAKPPTDLQLPNLQPDNKELSYSYNDATPVTPDSRPLTGNEEELLEDLEAITDPQSPEDDHARTLTENNFTKLTMQQHAAGEMKTSTSQDSDVTLSPYTNGEVTGSMSQQSLSEYKHLTPEAAANIEPSSSQEPPTPDTPQTPDGNEEAGITSNLQQSPKLENKEDVSGQSENEEASVNQSEGGTAFHNQPQGTIEVTDQTPAEPAANNTSSMLLIPEKLHTSRLNQDDIRTETSDQVYNIADDDELRLLIAEEAQLIWEEEELIAIKDELRQKIDTEIIEIDRLQEEIAEYEELRSITTLGHSSEAMSSDEYYSSTSDTEPEDDDAAQVELNNLVTTLHELTQRNNECEAENSDFVKKIHEERMGCVNVKIQIRLLLQQQLGSQAEEQSLI